MKRRRKRKLSNIHSVFDSMPVKMLGGVNFSVYENLGCTVESYGSIIEYADQQIKLGTSAGTLVIKGENLLITEMDGYLLSVTGSVSLIGYEEKSEV